MILLKRKKPLSLEIDEILLRRLPSNHNIREDIYLNYRRGLAGYRGEENLDYHLGFLPEKGYFIFQDLRLQVEGKSLQIDTLVITPHAMFIIESKNFQGTLFFDQLTNQFIRIYQNQEESFSDPIVQVRRQMKLLKQWLVIQKIKSVPIDYLVAISNPSTLLRTNTGMHHIFKNVVHTELIPDKLLQIESTYQEKILTPYLLDKLTNHLLSQQVPASVDIEKKYNIHLSELTTGVQCQLCSRFSMKRIYSTWYCLHCGSKNKSAHTQAIIDYIILYGTLTNSQCREFLHIESINVTTKLLEQSGLISKGYGKGKVYFRA